MIPRVRDLFSLDRSDFVFLIRTSTIVFDSDLFRIKSRRAVHPYGRMAIVTPKRVGTAPVRNLMKRRLKAIFYEEKLYTNNKDIVIFVKPKIHPVSFSKIKSILCALMAQ